MASPISATSSSKMVNSSPPRRAAVSSGRRQACMRLAVSTSSSSPALCPRLSLITLKLSRSRKSTAAALCRRAARARACSSRSMNSARFGRPDSGSWNARYESCCSKALRSVMSRTTAMDRCRSSSFSSLTTRSMGTRPPCWRRPSTSRWNPAEPAASDGARSRRRRSRRCARRPGCWIRCGRVRRTSGCRRPRCP